MWDNLNDWWHDLLVKIGFEICPSCEGVGMVRANFRRGNKYVIHKEPCPYCPSGRLKKRSVIKENANG